MTLFFQPILYCNSSLHIYIKLLLEDLFDWQNNASKTCFPNISAIPGISNHTEISSSIKNIDILDILAKYWNRVFKDAIKMLKVWPDIPCSSAESQGKV